jgi:hypothetical protein
MALRTHTASTRNQQTLSAALVLVAMCLTLALSSNASAQIVSGQKTVQVTGLSLLRFDQVEKFDSLRATAAIAIANLKAASEAATQNQAPSWNANEMRNLINNALASIGEFEIRQEVRNTIEAPKAQKTTVAQKTTQEAPQADQEAAQARQEAPAQAELAGGGLLLARVAAPESALEIEDKEELNDDQAPRTPAQSEWVHVPEPSSDGLAIAMLIILAALVAKSRRSA